MLREINLDEISDGKLYSSNDMARTDCKGCDGCSACCHGMGSSIVLDPLDVYRLSINLSKPVNELLDGPTGTECGRRDHSSESEDDWNQRGLFFP